MTRRIRDFGHDLSTRGMSSACAAGLRPVRKQARKRNFGFTDRTGTTREKIGKIKRYRPRTVRKYRGGGAYFRGGAKTALYLEYRNNAEYAFLGEAQQLTIGAQFREFTRVGGREMQKAARRSRRKLVRSLFR